MTTKLATISGTPIIVLLKISLKIISTKISNPINTNNAEAIYLNNDTNLSLKLIRHLSKFIYKSDKGNLPLAMLVADTNQTLSLFCNQLEIYVQAFQVQKYKFL